MKKNINQETKAEIKEISAFSQSIADLDYDMTKQYQEEEIAEQQILDEQIEEAMTANVSTQPTTEKEVTSETNSEAAEDETIDVKTAPAIVNPRIVKEIYDDFMKKPYAVTVRFYNEDGCLVMKIRMDFLKESHEHLIFTDTMFIGLVMRAMRNMEYEKWEEYMKEPHGVMATIEDPRIDIFRQFMSSKLKRRYHQDYISPAAKTYACFSFIINGLKEIHFCLERTSEINSIINKTYKVA